ncbi:uncharacterized protein LOC110118856 isoform X2 [Ceratitis capitata]|uniref:uncharacterized protein LOC110118856 isoform X2 n=1 Tax=Ceratitis capitata TaxID=7213 RepID=UPI000A119360|nr:uncharacterized protein LOC110118856 isoform X2 [Ceratitis capitata]
MQYRQLHLMDNNYFALSRNYSLWSLTCGRGVGIVHLYQKFLLKNLFEDFRGRIWHERIFLRKPYGRVSKRQGSKPQDLREDLPNSSCSDGMRRRFWSTF